MAKKIICLVISIIMLFSLTACGDMFGAQRQINELKNKIDKQGDRITDLENENELNDSRLAELDAENKSRDESFAELKEKVKELEERVWELETNEEWTNDNAVYAIVDGAEYVNEILSDVKGAFAELDFIKVYVTEKDIQHSYVDYSHLTLLFILKESGKDKQQEFIDILNLDKRISYAYNCWDIPFETIDTQHLDAPSDIVTVGETLEITLKGEYRCYTQSFDFDYIQVKLSDYDGSKTYTPADFPEVKLISVERYFDGWLYLKLFNPGYFNLVKAIDVLSRMVTINMVQFSYYINDTICEDPRPGPQWEISDNTIADFVETEWDLTGHNKATIIGLKPGQVTIYLSDWPKMRFVSYEITVIA